MEQALEILKRKALSYAKEAFEGHREQIFAAMQFMCLCSSVARQSGLLALDTVAGMCDEEDLREDEGDIALAVSMAKGDMPLKDLLISIIRRIADAPDWDDVEKEVLAQAEKNKCSGYEWYVIMIYLSGGKNILAGVDPERWFLMLRVMVPEQWLEDYDTYCRTWTENMHAEKRTWEEERAKKSFEKETSVKRAFNRVFGEMGPETLKFVIRELDYRTLAAGTAFAEERVRTRFLENMSERQRERVTEEWCWMRDSMYHLEDILEAMDRMLILAGLAS